MIPLLHNTLQDGVQLSFSDYEHAIFFFSAKINWPENNEKFEGNNSRSFFYVPPKAQQPRLGPWY